ncbi:ABC transporter substrate-binding protein [Pseudochelatococcus sp. B33]
MIHSWTPTRRTVASLLAASPFMLGRTTARAESQVETISISMLPILDAGPVLLTQKRDIFEKHGLDANVSTGGNGATNIPLVLSGQFDIAYTNVVSSLLAVDKKLPIVLVHPAYGHVSDPSKDPYRVYVDPNGPIQRPEQLASANIGTASLRSLSYWLIKKSLDNLGATDHSKQQWTRVQHEDGIIAVKNGQIDGIWLAEPHGVRAVRAGLVPILATNAGSLPGAVGGYFIASSTYAAKNPSVLRKFKASLSETYDFIADKPDVIRDAVIESLNFDKDLVYAANLNVYPNETDLAKFQVIAEDLVRYGLISAAPNLADLFWKDPAV